MFSGNYLNLDQFMARAHDRFRFLNHELDKARIKEWLYTAMGLIGVMKVYPDVNAQLVLTDDPDMKLSYAPIPLGIVQLNGVIDGTKANCETSLIASTALTGWDDKTSVPSYQINGGMILTNLCGNKTITLNYDSFPVDSEGNPMIPDDEVYIEAMLAYIGYRMGFELWMMDRLVEAKYRELEREWLFYVNSAKTKMLTPSLDEAQALANQLKQTIQSSTLKV